MKAVGLVGRLVGWVMLGVIRAYQWSLRPLLGGHCRFEPSCSRYAEEALRTWGPVRGGFLLVRRLLRCQPLGGGGFDPVPLREEGHGTVEARRNPPV